MLAQRGAGRRAVRTATLHRHPAVLAPRTTTQCPFCVLSIPTMDDDDDEPDLFSAESARDKALETVAANAEAWMGTARDALEALPSGYTGTFEEFRLALVHGGLEKPHHHNAWGALANTCLKMGVLIPTGDIRKMRTTKSHARRTPVYRLR
jgi:hypothetical protein